MLPVRYFCSNKASCVSVQCHWDHNAVTKLRCILITLSFVDIAIFKALVSVCKQQIVLQCVGVLLAVFTISNCIMYHRFLVHYLSNAWHPHIWAYRQQDGDWRLAIICGCLMPPFTIHHFNACLLLPCQNMAPCNRMFHAAMFSVFHLSMLMMCVQ